MDFLAEAIPALFNKPNADNSTLVLKNCKNTERTGAHEDSAARAAHHDEKYCKLELLPNELLFRVFSFLNIADLCAAARTSKGWYQIATLKGLWTRFPTRFRRIEAESLPPLSVWSPFAVSFIFKLSLQVQHIRAYNFLHCKCDIVDRVFNKVWFGHKMRRRQCDCETANDRLGWLVTFHIFLQYFLFFSVSASSIWRAAGESTWMRVTSIIFALLCSILNFSFAVMLKWYHKSTLYKAFATFASSLLIASSQQSPLFYQLFALTTSLILLAHLLCTKTDHGYRYQFVLEMVIFHLTVLVQWLVYQLPVEALPISSVALLPTLILMRVPWEHMTAYYITFGAWGTLWLFSLGVIQHAQDYLAILIPIPLTRDIVFWMRCLFMPIVLMEVFIPLDSTEQLDRIAGVSVLQRYSLRYGYSVVAHTYLALVLLATVQFVRLTRLDYVLTELTLSLLV